MMHAESNLIDPECVKHWFDVAASQQVDKILVDIYSTIEKETAKKKPICISSGRCCHFEKFGHRLYVTGLETAWCLLQQERNLQTEEVANAKQAGTCPFLENGLCSVHLIRPFGCRIFFCDAETKEWQEELYEQCHQLMQNLHQELDVEYIYQDWREMLALCVKYRSEQL